MEFHLLDLNYEARWMWSVHICTLFLSRASDTVRWHKESWQLNLWKPPIHCYYRANGPQTTSRRSSTSTQWDNSSWPTPDTGHTAGKRNRRMSVGCWTRAGLLRLQLTKHTKPLTLFGTQHLHRRGIPRTLLERTYRLDSTSTYTEMPLQRNRVSNVIHIMRQDEKDFKYLLLIPLSPYYLDKKCIFLYLEKR